MATNGTLKTSAYDGRYIEFAWTATSQDIANNKTTISWTLTAKGTGQYSQYYAAPFILDIDGQRAYYSETRILTKDGTAIASGTKTFTHNSNGSKSFSVSLQAAIYTYAINCSGSTTFTLDTIPRGATILSAPHFNDEENPVITYTNPLGNNVDSLWAYIYANDDKTVLIQGKAMNKTGSSFQFNFTEAERKVLRAYATANTATVHFFVRTVISGNEYWHGAPRTLSIINANPTATFTILDNNPDTLALTGSPQIVVKGHSTMAYTIDAEAKKEATIKNWLVRSGERTENGAYGSFLNATDGTFTYNVGDSRGNGASGQVELSVVDYVDISCNFKANIELDGETEALITIDISGNYFNGSFGAEDNEIWIEVRYKEERQEYGSWIPITEAYTPTFNNNTYSISTVLGGLEYDKSYTVEVRAHDKLTDQTAAEYVLTLTPIFDWSNNDFNFNVPISIKGQEMKDFIVEEGTSNGWTYRLWDSGAAECWRRLQITSNVNAAWGSLYTSGSLSSTNLSYPFTFAETPILSVSLMPFGSGGLIMATGNGYGSATQTGPFEIARGTSLSSGQFLIAYHAFGRWK